MSLTIKSIIILAILRFLSWAGIGALEGEIASFVLVASQLVAGFGIWYGRYRKGDIYWWGGKKKPETKPEE